MQSVDQKLLKFKWTEEKLVHRLDAFDPQWSQRIDRTERAGYLLGFTGSDAVMLVGRHVKRVNMYDIELVEEDRP